MLPGGGIDTVLINGILTSVCCESTARDATMGNFQIIRDGNAAGTDEEHNATLITFYLTFGDVMTTEAIGYLQANASASAAQA